MTIPLIYDPLNKNTSKLFSRMSSLLKSLCCKRLKDCYYHLATFFFLFHLLQIRRATSQFWCPNETVCTKPSLEKLNQSWVWRKERTWTRFIKSRRQWTRWMCNCYLTNCTMLEPGDTCWNQLEIEKKGKIMYFLMWLVVNFCSLLPDYAGCRQHLIKRIHG